MPEKSMPQALSELDQVIAYVTGEDETLKHLSWLQRAYEWNAKVDRRSDETEHAADLLSHEVGRLLVAHGYEATL